MPSQVPRVQIVPQPDDQVSVQVDGRERLRWYASPRDPRPFFFPLVGPSGRSVTRMGHPADPTHDHHRSFWWGHHDVAGVSLWQERPNTPGGPHIRQESWVHYQDGAQEAGFVVRIGWFDAHKVRLVHQEMIAVYRPLPNDEGWLELQTTFTPVLDVLPLGKTNFGFLGLRVAASISAHYGGGVLTNSEGARGESTIFAKPARWTDYSGPTAGPIGAEGVTWFDHPSNPRHPTPWHVRDDGWMSAAFCLNEGYELRKDRPLRLRYGLHVHAGQCDTRRANERVAEFSGAAAWELTAASRPWLRTLRRAAKAT
ncbi:MAG TPA: PmoA family protein [Gemmataceae bacterium]|nr:PmoA family protein [Gemmataceae bacterium]